MEQIFISRLRGMSILVIVDYHHDLTDQFSDWASFYSLYYDLETSPLW